MITNKLPCDPNLTLLVTSAISHGQLLFYDLSIRQSIHQSIRQSIHESHIFLVQAISKNELMVVGGQTFKHSENSDISEFV